MIGRYARHGPTASRYCFAMTRAVCAMCPRSCADPGRQQLPQRDRSELGMLARQIELGVGQAPSGERGQILGAKARELVEQIAASDLPWLSWNCAKRS